MLLSTPSDDGLRFDLALPQLRKFCAQHVMVDGPGDFGLSLSRCPRLEEVETYKFRCLSGDNFTILPACKRLSLYRSECTDSIEVLSAPKLESLSVRAAYSLRHVRLWDLPCEVLVEDVEVLVKELDEKSKEISQEVWERAEKWKDGSFNGEDAYDLNWIDFEDVENFDFKTSPHMEEILYEHAQNMFDKKRATAKGQLWKRFKHTNSMRQEIHPLHSLPPCEVNIINASLSHASLAHLRGNKRVSVLDDPNDDCHF